MTKLQITLAKKLEKFLYKLGFVRVRQKGSHVFYRHVDGRTTTIPHHHGQDLARPLLRTILREIKVDIDTFNKSLRKI